MIPFISVQAGADLPPPRFGVRFSLKHWFILAPAKSDRESKENFASEPWLTASLTHFAKELGHVKRDRRAI